MTGTKLDIQRIRVNAEGYDSSGAYWGAGPDVFIASIPAGQGRNEEITVRATSMKDAHARIDAEIARQPGAARAKDKLGGKSPRISRYEIDWQNPADHTTVKIRITHARDYLSQGTDHIEIEAIKPKRKPLPITETGYLSHFIDWQQLSAAGGPVTFVTAWLEREGLSKAWTRKEAARAQGDLFQWGETKAETASGAKRSGRKTAAASERRVSKRNQRAPGRDHG